MTNGNALSDRRAFLAVTALPMAAALPGAAALAQEARQQATSRSQAKPEGDRSTRMQLAVGPARVKWIKILPFDSGSGEKTHVYFSLDPKKSGYFVLDSQKKRHWLDGVVSSLISPTTSTITLEFNANSYLNTTENKEYYKNIQYFNSMGAITIRVNNPDVKQDDITDSDHFECTWIRLA